ncbi:RING-H2 finger protein ATL54-like [Camellia sinensis]|uniref:RING-type E3 ubiquitin transferase n=1 Tax=Camellia sinensis var. sinensis TaxID=542762 RepID=A0A4S4EZ31_CAMSN|nr:RING-H2 finger protein ATL54-like [Camellia sinensis]THG22370.1 hypothetical protein TEA_012590 [Camellia sinensis var. sinensis]
MKHRKLFPPSTATNQTQCPEFCDPTCPDGCYPYADFYFMPPPPPPPPPPSLSTGQSQQVSADVIITVSILSCFFLLISYYMLILKYCSGRTHFRPPPRDQSDGRDEEFRQIDHPIWFINTVGLQPSVINSITVFKFKKGDPLIEGRECLVCLSEFQEDETLRLLPKCNHAFHIPCIDTWLRSHTNCPLCRAGIVASSVSTRSDSNTQNSFTLNRQDETQMENLAGGCELGDSWVGEGEECENRAETEDGVELTHGDDQRKELDDSKESVNSINGIGLFSVVSCLEDKNMVMEDAIQPMKSSVSMDSSSSATNHLCIDESEGNAVNQKEIVEQSDLGIVQTQDHASSTTNRMIGSSSIGQSLYKSPVFQ